MSINGRPAKSQLIVGHGCGFTFVWRKIGRPEVAMLAASMKKIILKFAGLEMLLKIKRNRFPES